MARLVFPLLIAAFLCASRTSFVAADGLDSFVRNKMANFTAWIKVNNLDPSPPMIEAFHISNSGIVAAIETEISNLLIENHSEGSLNVDYVMPELPNGLFYVGFVLSSSISFSGYHQTNATILSSIPVSADGRFWINVTYINPRSFGMEFAIGSSGYLNATRFVDGQFDLPTSGDAYFEGVTDSEAAQGYEEFVEAAFYKGFQDWIIWDRGDPFRSTFLKYWQSVLAESTLADIIGATDPPTTSIATEASTWPSEASTWPSEASTWPSEASTWPSEASTWPSEASTWPSEASTWPSEASTWPTETASTTTPQPCQNYGQESHCPWKNDVTVLDEHVIKSRKSVDENGNPVILKTRLIVTQEKEEL